MAGTGQTLKLAGGSLAIEEHPNSIKRHDMLNASILCIYIYNVCVTVYM